jgi:hypothetical protein
MQKVTINVSDLFYPIRKENNVFIACKQKQREIRGKREVVYGK